MDLTAIGALIMACSTLFDGLGAKPNGAIVKNFRFEGAKIKMTTSINGEATKRPNEDDESKESSFGTFQWIGVAIGGIIFFIDVFIFAMCLYCRYKKKQYAKEAEKRAVREMEVMYGLMEKRTASSIVEEPINMNVAADTELDDLSIESLTPGNFIWEEKFKIRVPKTLKKKDNPPRIVDPDEEFLSADEAKRRADVKKDLKEKREAERKKKEEEEKKRAEEEEQEKNDAEGKSQMDEEKKNFSKEYKEYEKKFNAESEHHEKLKRDKQEWDAKELQDKKAREEKGAFLKEAVKKKAKEIRERKENERKKGGKDADEKEKKEETKSEKKEEVGTQEVTKSAQKEEKSTERSKSSKEKTSKQEDLKGKTDSKEKESKENSLKPKTDPLIAIFKQKVEAKQKAFEEKKKLKEKESAADQKRLLMLREKRKLRRRMKGNTMIYKILDRLNEGSFGVLYRFKCKDEKYAVKFVPTADPKAMNKVRTVYANFKRIHCQGKKELIMHFVDIGRTPDTTYLIMPCLRKGMDMKKIGGVELKKKFLLIYHYLRPIVQLQSVKIAHLSITPRNYLNRPGTPHLVLTDLGLARRYGYRRKEVVGTAAYLSVPAHHCEPVSMVDDMQSWFIICTELLEYPLPWSDIVDNGEEGYKKTLDIKQRYLTMMSQSPNFGEFLTELRNEIWDKGAKDTIDMVRVSTLIEDLQMQYQFRLTEAWE